jgi:hypothetical protein
LLLTVVTATTAFPHLADALQPLLVAVDAPAWHLLPQPLPELLIQQLQAGHILALAGAQADVLANGIRRPAQSE